MSKTKTMKKTAKNLCDPNVFRIEVAPRRSPEWSSASEQNRSRPIQGGAPSHPPSKRVLMMVDVEEGDAPTRSLRDSLRRGEVEVETCTDVPQALQRFMDNDYDLILIDLQSQVLDGFGVCRELKRIRGDARIGFLTIFPIY